MHGCIVSVASSFSSVFKELINVSYLSSYLLLIVISFSILENIFGIEQLFIDVFRGQIAATYNKNLGRYESGGFRLGSLHFFEELFKDPHKRLKIC
jgi:hypothetical protein